MQENKQILKSVYGSHLFGLNTPASDEDFYEIFQVNTNDIILQKDKDCYTKENNNTQVKELRRFIKDAMSGQTYAIELLFAPDTAYLYTSDEWNFIKSNRDKLVSRNLRPFLAYATNQAKKYSYKSTQLKRLNVFMDEVKEFKDNTRLKDILDRITMDESICVENFGNQILLKVISKRYDVMSKLKDILPSINSTLAIYGTRAWDNQDREYDPKAYSHALRLSYMLDELMNTGKVSIPVINREYLLSVKLSKVPFEEVNKELARVLDKIDSNINVLPESPDIAFWNNYMLSLYLN